MALTIELIPGETWPDGSAINLPRLRNTAKPSIKIDGLLGTADIENGAITEPKLADNAVSTRTIQNRAVTQAKLALDALFYLVDTGTADAGVVTLAPAAGAYVAGMSLWIKKVASANTGTYTLNVNGLGVTAVRKHGATELAASDLASGQVFHVVYDGTIFHLIGILPIPADATYESGLLTMANAGYTVQSLAHGLGGVPDHLDIRWVCVDAGGDVGYAENEEVPSQGVTQHRGSSELNALIVRVTSTHVHIGYDQTWGVANTYVRNGTTGDYAADGIGNEMTLTKWRVRVRALRFA